tara:strand:+ start:14 stop:184 length:171 start_codon:yes stop_codon:yes gene_type:complete
LTTSWRNNILKVKEIKVKKKKKNKGKILNRKKQKKKDKKKREVQSVGRIKKSIKEI